MRRRLLPIIICITVSLNLLWAFPAWGETDYSTIRVALSSLGTPESVSFIVRGAYRIAGEDIPLTPGAQYSLRRQGDELVLQTGAKSWKLGDRCYFQRLDDGFETCLEVCNTAYGWRKYLGNMEMRTAEKGIRLINHIYLEHYLYGVVPHEMSDNWPLEALKAQAVAARTYAVRCKNPVAPYDLGDTGAHQIYKGYDGSKANCIRAVDGTVGQVVSWQGAFAGTYYTSSNGGWVESTHNRWGGALPYSQVKEDLYDARNPQNPHRVWSVAYHRLAVDPGLESRLVPCMQEVLKARGYSDAAEDIDILQIKSIEPDAPNTSGRRSRITLSLMVQAKKRSNGRTETVEQPVELTGNAIMNVLGLKSLLFTVQTTGEQCVIQGAGSGHGVGMSQYGARQMAEEGLSYADILSFYYPDTALTTLAIHPPALPQDAGDSPEPGPTPTPAPIPSPSPAAPLTGETGAEEEYGTVNVSTSLNVRQGPGLQYQKTGTLPNGTRVLILTRQGEWWEVQAGDLKGYVYARYITPDAPAQQNPTPEPLEQEPPPTEDPAPPPDQNRQRGVVTASALYIRSGPSTKNHKMGLYVRGTEVEITGRQGNWYRIVFQDTQGYVYSQYIRILAPGEDESPIGTGVITASWLNVRTGPGIQYERVAQLQQGTHVEIMESEGQWHRIRFDGQTGYVFAGYVGQIPTAQRGASTVAIQGTVTASRVNIRSGPSLTSLRVGTLSRGDSIVIRGAENGWYFFEYQGAQSYVHSSLVAVAGYTTAKVTPNVLNVRSGPGSQYPVAGQLRQGASVIILSESGDWTCILQGDGAGYVYSAYLDK